MAQRLRSVYPCLTRAVVVVVTCRRRRDRRVSRNVIVGVRNFLVVVAAQDFRHDNGLRLVLLDRVQRPRDAEKDGAERGTFQGLRHQDHYSAIIVKDRKNKKHIIMLLFQSREIT